jgi:predicted DCC family thiol-disulfide oxidoreductase YuxK
MKHPIVFFDGDCPFCSRSVLFLIKIDNTQQLRYARLSSQFAERFLGALYQEAVERDTIVLSYNDQLYFESDALIMALKSVNRLSVVSGLLALTPRAVRNFFYRKVARNRRRLASSCPAIPLFNI